MVVFYYFVSFILIIILLLMIVLVFSSITLELVELKINDTNTISTIINCVCKKQYERIFNYIKIESKIKIKVFNILPINIITIDNKKIIKLIENNKNKIQITQKNKEIGKTIATNLINKHLQIDQIDIDISLGLHNAHYTALISTLITIIIAITLNIVTDDRIKKYKSEQKQEKYTNKNFKYKVNPIYSEEIVFNLRIKFKITMKIISIIKEILMYKSNLFVNNTNKYKVKES